MIVCKVFAMHARKCSESPGIIISIMFESFSVFAHGKSLLLRFFFIISGDHGDIHPQSCGQKMEISGAYTS